MKKGKKRKSDSIPVSRYKSKLLFWKSLGFIFLLILIARMNWKDTLMVLKKVDFRFFILGALLEPLRFLVEAGRWKILLSYQKIHYRLKEAFLILLAGNYLGHITPGRIGNFIRALYIQVEKKISLGFAFSSVILDKYLELIFTFIFGIIGAIFYLGGRKLFALTSVAAPLLLLLYFIIYAHNVQNLFLKWFNKKLFFRLNLGFNMQEFRRGLSFINKSAIFVASLVSIFSFLIYAFHGYLICLALKIKISFLNFALAFYLVKMISRMIPVSFSGWGSKDISLILIFKKLGIGYSTAFSYTILFLFSSYFVSLLLGFLGWESRPLLWGKK